MDLVQGPTVGDARLLQLDPDSLTIESSKLLQKALPESPRNQLFGKLAFLLREGTRRRHAFGSFKEGETNLSFDLGADLDFLLGNPSPRVKFGGFQQKCGPFAIPRIGLEP